MAEGKPITMCFHGPFCILFAIICCTLQLVESQGKVVKPYIVNKITTLKLLSLEKRHVDTRAVHVRQHEQFKLKDNLDFTFILPHSWQSFCNVKYRLITGSNFTSRNAFHISCQPRQGDKWSLKDYRIWARSIRKNFYSFLPNPNNISVALKLQCKDRSVQLSLPMPAKAQYLWYVSVDNCTVTDHLLEYDIQHVNIPDTLAVLEITNSIITVNSHQFFQKARNYQNTSREFYCGSEQLQKFILRNNTKTFTMKSPILSSLSRIDFDHPLENNNVNINKDNNKVTKLDTDTILPKNEEEMNRIFLKLTQDHLRALYRCNHKELRYLEESYQSSMSRHHSHFMLENAWYPALEYFNMSHSGIVTMGPHMLDWRRYFPKMKYMDLSYNNIKYFTALTDNGLANDTVGILDLRYNNITALTSNDLDALSLHSNTVFVDIRENPIICDCKLKTIVQTLQNGSVILKRKYKYLKGMKCASPQIYTGTTLNNLEPNFCEAMKFIVLSAPLVAVSSSCVVILALFFVILCYRKEIMILAFTRLHISLPCRKVYKSNDKKYDAFIAYSEQDSQWVIHTLLPRLERNYNSSGPGLKLCIHHRDFPIGGCISDNILDKIKDSRHTVLILSNNFLNSHWCKYEFKAAFTQSLMDKKQHLIMVLLEDLDQPLIDKTLRQCLKTFTYVKSDDKLFWDKIIYALSDRDKQVIHPSIYSCNSIPSMSQVSSVKAPNGRLRYSNTISSFLNGYSHTNNNSITKNLSGNSFDQSVSGNMSSTKPGLSVISEDCIDQIETKNVTVTKDSVAEEPVEPNLQSNQSTEIYEVQNSSNSIKETFSDIYQNTIELPDTSNDSDHSADEIGIENDKSGPSSSKSELDNDSEKVDRSEQVAVNIKEERGFKVNCPAVSDDNRSNTEHIMPQWYHCGRDGCQFGDFRYHPHECPEINNFEEYKRWCLFMGVKPKISIDSSTLRNEVIEKKVPWSDIKDSDIIDEPVTQKTPAIVPSGTAQANVLSDKTKDAQALEYIIQHGNQDNNEVVAMMPFTCDKKGRLLIVFPQRKQDSYFEKQIILNCLNAFIIESGKLKMDRSGFTVVLDGISKSEEVRFLTHLTNDVLKDKLKLILVVNTQIMNKIHDPKPGRHSNQVTPRAPYHVTETSMLSEDADSYMLAIVPFFISVQGLLDYISADQLSPNMGGTRKSRFISKPIYDASFRNTRKNKTIIMI